MIYLIVSFVLDILISNMSITTFGNLNYIFPNILVASFPICFILIKNKKLYFFLVILLGLIYDTLYSDIFFINAYFFILYSLFLYVFYKNRKVTVLNIVLTSVFCFILYDLFIFFLLILLEISNFKINDLYYKILHSFIINFIYILISILILKSRIFSYKKSKRR